MSTTNPVTRQDWVFVEQYQAEASIGVFEWEKRQRQSLYFDLELQLDFERASQTDDIADALSYVDVCQCIDELIARQHYHLLETLAERLSELIFERYQVSRLTLSIHKPGAVPKARSVGVKIIRERLE